MSKTNKDQGCGKEFLSDQPKIEIFFNIKVFLKYCGSTEWVNVSHLFYK